MINDDIKYEIDETMYEKAKNMGMGDFYIECEKLRAQMGISREEFSRIGRNTAKEIHDTNKNETVNL